MGSQVFETPEDIQRYQWLVWRKALWLDIKGVPVSRQEAPSVLIRRAMGSKTRNKAKLHDEFTAWLQDKGVLQKDEV